jgi:hypothetical protein
LVLGKTNSVREGAAGDVAPRARRGGGCSVEQVGEVAELVHLFQARRHRREWLLLRRRRDQVGASLVLLRPPGGLMLLLPRASEVRPARTRPLRLRRQCRLGRPRQGGGGLAGEALHDGLEAGGVGADELRLDELDLHAGVLVPPGALDIHGHAPRC